jgi:hypothetical protein
VKPDTKAIRDLLKCPCSSPHVENDDARALCDRVEKLEAALASALPLAERWAEGDSKSSPVHDEIALLRAILEGR